jgi:hypothetical protein
MAKQKKRSHPYKYVWIVTGTCLALSTIIVLFKAYLPRPNPVSINEIGAANQLLQPKITVLAPISETNLYFNDYKGIMNAEITPWALGSKRTGGWYTYLISTFDTFMCTTPSNIFTLKETEKIIDRKTCRLRLEPGINPDTLSTIGSIPLWRRDYHGTFSAHLITVKNQGPMVYAVNHGESYNNDSLAIRFPASSLPPCVQVADMGYGSLPCEPKYLWGSYNAWITLSSMPWTLKNLNGSTKFSDLGPITWPSNGYIESLDNGKSWVKATDGGVRHPSSIIKDNYLYVFYEDLSSGVESNGRGPGFKVVRAPITSDGIKPSDFRAYFQGNFSEPTLPADFNLAKYYLKLAARGPKATNIFPNSLHAVTENTLGARRTGGRIVSDVMNFSVAKVNGTPYYLGVGNDLSLGTTLRLSTDLVNWSSPIVVPGTEANWWVGKIDIQKTPLLYPRLMNADGDSNTDIDPQEFYITGTQTKLHGPADAKVVNAIKLKLTLP